MTKDFWAWYIMLLIGDTDYYIKTNRVFILDQVKMVKSANKRNKQKLESLEFQDLGNLFFKWFDINMKRKEILVIFNFVLNKM